MKLRTSYPLLAPTFSMDGASLSSSSLGESASSQRDDGQFEKRLMEWFVQREMQSRFQ